MTKVFPGEPLAIPADVWNTLGEVADAWVGGVVPRRSPDGGGTRPAAASPFSPRLSVLAFRWDGETATIADRAPCVLRFFDYELPGTIPTEPDGGLRGDPFPGQGVAVYAVSPTDADAGTAAEVAASAVGIAVGNLAPGTTGPVLTGGTCLAWVDVVDESHRYAVLDSTTADNLVSAPAGPVRILYADGTGRQLALVLLNAGSGGGGGTGVAIDNVHVVNVYDNSAPPVLVGWQCERVTQGTGDVWPPTVAVPAVVYPTVRESENRLPRLRDEPGVVSHIIPLFRDAAGNLYITFWRVYATYTKDEVTDWTWDPTTCTVAPTIVNYTFTLKAALPGNAETGLVASYAPTPGVGWAGSITTWDDSPVVWGLT